MALAKKKGEGGGELDLDGQEGVGGDGVVLARLERLRGSLVRVAEEVGGGLEEAPPRDAVRRAGVAANLPLAGHVAGHEFQDAGAVALPERLHEDGQSVVRLHDDLACHRQLVAEVHDLVEAALGKLRDGGLACRRPHHGVAVLVQAGAGHCEGVLAHDAGGDAPDFDGGGRIEAVHDAEAEAVVAGVALEADRHGRVEAQPLAGVAGPKLGRCELGADAVEGVEAVCGQVRHLFDDVPLLDAADRLAGAVVDDGDEIALDDAAVGHVGLEGALAGGVEARDGGLEAGFVLPLGPSGSLHGAHGGHVVPFRDRLGNASRYKAFSAWFWDI